MKQIEIIKEKIKELKELINNIDLKQPISYSYWKLLHNLVYDIIFDLIWLDI